MLIALLAVLGVDLIFLVGLLGVAIARKRWVVRQPGVFRGLVRVTSGEIDGFRPKWSRGYGRWVRDVFVWVKAPFFFRNELLAPEGLGAERRAGPGEFKRLGDEPLVMRLRIGGATAEVAADGRRRELLLGPYSKPFGVTESAGSVPGNQDVPPSRGIKVGGPNE